MENEERITRRKAITAVTRIIAGASLFSTGFYEYGSTASKIDSTLKKKYPQVEEGFYSEGLGGHFEPDIKNEYKNLPEQEKEEILSEYEDDKFKMQRTPEAGLQYVVDIFCAATGVGSIISGIKEANEVEERDKMFKQEV